MDPMTKRPASAARTVFCFCTLPQLIRIGLNLLTEWVAVGRIGGDAALLTALSAGADFFGIVSFFAGLGAAIRLAFVSGTVGNGLVWVPLITLDLTARVAFLIFGRIPWQAALAVFAAASILMVFLFCRWLRREKVAAGLIAGSLFLAIPGGLVILLTTAPTEAELAAGISYGFADFSLTMLLLTLAVLLASAFRRRRKDQGAVRRSQLRVMLISDLIYTAILTLTALPVSISEVTEYGWPVNAAEWFSFLQPYGEHILFFLLGLAVMAFIADRLNGHNRGAAPNPVQGA